MPRRTSSAGAPSTASRWTRSPYLEFYLQAPEYFRMLAFPSDPGRYQAGRDLAEQLAESVNEQNTRMVEALRRGMKAGLIRPVDPDEIATILWSAWNGIISLGWRPDGPRRSEAELRELLKTATHMIADGLLPRDRKSTRLNSSHHTTSRMPSSA